MSILIFGSTGFLGTNLLCLLNEKKYKKNIFLLIRDKRGKTSKERFNEVKKNFNNLNLILIDKNLLEVSELKLNVDIVINCAASVDFDLKLKDAIEQNVDSVIEILKYVKNNNIKNFIHISTAYVSEPGKVIKEKFVNMKILGEPEDLYRQIKNNKITFKEIITNKFFPNTYCFTKCLSEKLIEKEMRTNTKTIFSIVRPSIITNAIKSPYLGWFQGYNAAIGFHKLIKMKLLRSLTCNETTKLDYVPVDYVSNIIIESINDKKNVIKHATSFFKILPIKDITNKSQEFIPLFYENNLYTYCSRFYVNLTLIISMIYYYLLSFIDNYYIKKYKKQYRIIDIVNTTQKKFNHFLNTTYIFDKTNVNTTNFTNYVSIDQYYRILFEKI
jgi:nucleoside-diphosphate-sugar epimerase